MSEDAHEADDEMLRRAKEWRRESEQTARYREALMLLKRADNWARYAHITVIVNGQPVTTVGNILAEAVGESPPPSGDSST